MTLIEVVVALTILSLSMGGIFAALMQSRRLTEGSVVQTSALTIVQGYMEQLKNTDLANLINGGDSTYIDSASLPTLKTTSYSILTYKDSGTVDSLKTSTGTPPTLSSIVPGTTPTGIQDNLKGFDVAKDTSATTMSSTDTSSAQTSTAQIAWTSIWPNASDYTTAAPATTTGRVDLHLNMWVWISKQSSSSISNVASAYGITIIYTWQYKDGNRIKYILGTVRSIRSSVTN